jgi:TolB-like protein
VESNKAVFLSYANQDAQAASRICEALRGAGIEVWFDQSELRGGDAWDAAIRRQIKNCALVVPIISANTQGRAEGYFRLEWKLAIDRSHLMALDRTFLVPVVIDQVNESDGRVPDKFSEVQWTRLPGGATSPAFIERIARLLEQDLKPADGASRSIHTDPPAATVTPSTGPALPRARGLAPLALGAVLVIASIGVGAWALRHEWRHAAAIVPYSNEDRRMTFAVLPFQAAAEDAHGAQVAKATRDELQTVLETRKDNVSVVPQASAEQAAAHELSVRKLARDLNVHFLVRGSVAREGDAYKVTVLGIDGDSERVLTTASVKVAQDAVIPRWRDDVDEIVGKVVRSATTTEVKRARPKPDDELDVRDLAMRASIDWRSLRDTDGKTANANANVLLRRALAIAPDDPYALRTMATINLCDCVNTWSPNPEEQKAIGAEAMEKYLRIDPNAPAMLEEKANLYQLRLRWEESMAIADSLLARDPDSVNALGLKATALLHMGQAKESRALADQFISRYPSDWYTLQFSANVDYALANYAGAAQQAQKSIALMSEAALRDRVTGTVRLTMIAAEARLGHLDRAKAAFADFKTTLPNVTTISAIQKWMHPSADLADFPPLYDGLRMAGISN